MGDSVTTLWDTTGNPVSVWDATGNLIWENSPDPVDPVGPDTIEGQIAAARPTKFTHIWDIAADGSKDYTTITAAAAAAEAVTAAENGGRMRTWVSPHRRHLFRVWPGEYREPNVQFPSHFALIGMGSVPEDVRIWDDRGHDWVNDPNPPTGKYGENIINSSGRSMWVENLWMDHQHSDPKWHAIRIVGAAGDIGRNHYTPMTAMFRSVRMTSAATGLAGKCAVDATISQYEVVFDQCWFDTPGQPQAVNFLLGYESHIPSAVIFHGCKVTAGYDFIDDPLLPNNGRFADGTIPGAIPIGVHGAQGGAGAAYWVETADSAWDIGRQAPAPDVPPRSGIAVVPSTASITQFHISDLPVIDPESPSLIVNSGAGWIEDPVEYSERGHLDRVIPDTIPELTARDGASALERAFYGPDPAVVPPPARVTPVGSPVQASFPAGRIYFVPIPAPNVGFRLGAAEWDLATDGDIGVASAYSNPLTGVPYSTAGGQMWASGAAPSGATSATMIRRWYYPGHGTMWLAVGTQGADGTGILATEAGPTVYFADAYTGGSLPSVEQLAVLPAGEAYPVVTAVMS